MKLNNELPISNKSSLNVSKSKRLKISIKSTYFKKKQITSVNINDKIEENVENSNDGYSENAPVINQNPLENNESSTEKQSATLHPQRVAVELVIWKPCKRPIRNNNTRPKGNKPFTDFYLCDRRPITPKTIRRFNMKIGFSVVLIVFTWDMHVVKGRFHSSNGVCGRQQYDPRIRSCCGGVVTSKGSCCGTRSYDYRFRSCCRGVITSKGSCCGTRSYDYRFRSCCGGMITSKGSCCGTRSYDYRLRSCCGVVITSKGSCCGTSSYDYRFRSCCKGKITSKGSCCGTKSYDYRYRSCCGGMITSKGSCCGTITYDNRFRSCCKGKITSKGSCFSPFVSYDPLSRGKVI
ncbi:Hypothetical predicted protein [Mytilus galloprovincialis]|uniref:Galaxin-like repeats domain-containing protein n=1 Tax=Mytilus galloprovincialis TaxID=29158 RepID=A0A8B6EBK0_MYTGA|nr:Hypothetical predicted protein [Mytilus galloprovincialis]